MLSLFNSTKTIQSNCLVAPHSGCVGNFHTATPSSFAKITFWHEGPFSPPQELERSPTEGDLNFLLHQYLHCSFPEQLFFIKTEFKVTDTVNCYIQPLFQHSAMQVKYSYPTFISNLQSILTSKFRNSPGSIYVGAVQSSS